MYPGCRFMDLHPRERDQMSYAPHHGSARSPVNYESFPCYGSYGYPYPFPYHGCYHNQIPDYHGYGLHYPHYAPPPPVYCNDGYPPLPGSYPFQYLPSPHYSAMDPRFEYDRKGPIDHHCCGCPNHLCQQKENKNVKIEEQISDDGKDKVASLVPSELKNQSYPFLWIPPGYKRNDEGEQTIKPESNKVNSVDKGAEGSLKPCAQEQGVWNGWLPIDLNSLNSMVRGRDEKGTEHKHNGDSKSSHPVGCMPSYHEQKDKMELKDGDQKSIWDPSQLRIFPLNFIENQDEKSMPQGDVKKIENTSSEDDPKTGDRNVVKKIIPVKQMDQSEEKVLSKNDQSEENRESKVEKNHNEMPLKLTDNKGRKEHLENNSNVHSSLSKASKLPPVCLRVDPLPNRKTKGGSSRSPSPPGNKKKSEMLSHVKSSSSPNTQGNSQQHLQPSADSDLSRLQNEKKEKNIEAVDSTLRDNKGEAQKEESQYPVNAGDSQERVSSGCQDENVVKNDQEFSLGDGVKDVDKLSGEITKDDKVTIEVQSGDVKCETRTEGGPRGTKKSEHASTNGAPNQMFSEAEAAVIIQSAYRGFEVRRWEPLKKLKEIARIEGELNKVRLDVQNLVSSGSGNIDKQRMVIGETIMNLLLQLDTMQGLHPSVRNIRKSVAKGLVSLQEKLDSITSQNAEELKESDISKHDGGEEERQEAGEDRHEQDTTSPSNMKSGVMELGQDQLYTLMDMNIGSVDHVEKSELLSGTDGMGRASRETQQDSSDYVYSNGRHLEPVVEVKEPSEVDGVRENHGSFSVESKELPPSIIAEDKREPVVLLQNLSSLVDSDMSSKEDEVAKVYTEVTPLVPEQNSDARVSGEGLQIDGGRCVVEPGKRELAQESGLISLGNKAKETSVDEQQHRKLPTESLKLPDLEDNIATAVCSVSSPELKDNISTGGDLETYKELNGDDMLGTEFMEASNKKHVNNIKEEVNDCVVGLPTVVEIDTKEISEIKEVANACEVEGEGYEKLVDDRNSVRVEMKEIPDIKEAVNVCEVEGDYKPVDDMQTADSIGFEQKGAQEVNEPGKDVGPVGDIGSIETCGLELGDLSKVTLDLQGKQQKPKYTVSGEEVHVEEISNCSSGLKMAVDEDQEMWEDKFANKEISQEHSNGNIVDLPRDEDLVVKEHTAKKINNRVFSTGKEDLAGEEIIVKEPRKESDQELVEENEKLKETVEKLIAAGREQLTAISSLSERVKDLEKKLSRKKKLKMRRHRVPILILGE
ncbi:hypothetical protein POM88_033009 [Heracleum sosnowskyi]|uniref:BAG domain-containing protein n=1 Tax=Heracleum sosnowskyi TaxID=360622 RepID=A0AAD8MKN0_9APIA|nr:hypothetical protein POM88_033009 [Heracleum sosnowskyi]